MTTPPNAFSSLFIWRVKMAIFFCFFLILRQELDKSKLEINILEKVSSRILFLCGKWRQLSWIAWHIVTDISKWQFPGICGLFIYRIAQGGKELMYLVAFVCPCFYLCALSWLRLNSKSIEGHTDGPSGSAFQQEYEQVGQTREDASFLRCLHK